MTTVVQSVQSDNILPQLLSIESAKRQTATLVKRTKQDTNKLDAASELSFSVECKIILE